MLRSSPGGRLAPACPDGVRNQAKTTRSSKPLEGRGTKSRRKVKWPSLLALNVGAVVWNGNWYGVRGIRGGLLLPRCVAPASWRLSCARLPWLSAGMTPTGSRAPKAASGAACKSATRSAIVVSSSWPRRWDTGTGNFGEAQRRSDLRALLCAHQRGSCQVLRSRCQRPAQRGQISASTGP